MKEDPNGVRVQAPPPSAQPSPEQIAAQAKLLDSQTKAQKVQVDAEKNATESQDRMAELAGEKDIETVRLAQTLVAHASDAKAADRTHALDANKHALDVAKTVHDATMDRGQLALDTHQALNPPQPDAGTDDASRARGGRVETHPTVPGARKAKDGRWYVPDGARPGKYLMVVSHA
jgi:hypothetical protein